jgi:ferrous iron transport protein A
MPIVIAPLNVDLKIVKILVDEKLKRHLESLGITINSTIKIISNQGGNIIVMVKDGRLALDRGISTKILVA